LKDLSCFFTKLANDANGDLLAFFYLERMALVAVDAAEGFVVNFHFQGLLGFLFSGGFAEVAQAPFSIRRTCPCCRRRRRNGARPNLTIVV